MTLHFSTERDWNTRGTWYILSLGEPNEVEEDGTPIYWITSVALKRMVPPVRRLLAILQFHPAGGFMAAGRIIQRWKVGVPNAGGARIFVCDDELHKNVGSRHLAPPLEYRSN